jgi:hypothetical protein
LRIEPQIGFAMAGILPVAAQAVVGEQRQHLATETHRLRESGGGQGEWKKQAE